MDRLWSPWRYKYVSKSLPEGGCIFCLKASEDRDEENLLLHRGKHNFVLLNLFPYTNGHLMIAPYAHAATLNEAPAEALTEMIELAREAERRLMAAYKAPGMNLGMNVGEAAGAGIAGHIHLHVLPRWAADSNFMTTIAETRVIPEDLHDTWLKLKF